MIKIKAIVCVGILALLCVGGYGYYKYTHSVDVSTNTEAMQATKKDSIEASDDINNTQLDEEQRKEYMRIYNERGNEIEKKITVTDEEVEKYMKEHAGNIQYPGIKLVCEGANGNDNIYYLDDEDLLYLKPGDQSDYGVVKSVGDLDESDERAVVESIIHSNKITNTILKEMKNGK